MRKNFSNIAEESEALESSSQEKSYSVYQEVLSLYESDISYALHKFKDMNYTLMLEDIQKSNQILQEENDLMSFTIEKANKDCRLSIINIENTMIDCLKTNCNDYNNILESIKRKIENFKDKFYMQILRLNEAFNSKLTEKSVKIQKIVRFSKRLTQEKGKNKDKYEMFEEKYNELIKERVVMQERAENKTVMILNLRMAIESMNFAREQVGKLNSFDSKKIFQVFLDKINAFEQCVNAFSRICQKNESAPDELNAMIRNMKKELRDKDQKIAKVREDFQNLGRFIDENRQNIEDCIGIRLDFVNTKIEIFEESLIMKRIKDKNQYNKNLKLDRKKIVAEKSIKSTRKSEFVFEKQKGLSIIGIENNELKVKFKDLEEKYNKITQEIAKIRSNNIKLAEELEIVLSEKAKMEVIIEEQLIKCKETEKIIKNLTKENQNLVKEQLELKNTIENLNKNNEKDLDLSNNSLEMRFKFQTPPETPDNDDRVLEIISKLEEKTDEVLLLSQSQQDLLKSNSKLARKVQRLIGKISKLEGIEENTKRIAENNEDLKNKLHEKDEEIEKMQKSNNDIKGDNKKLTRKIKKLTKMAEAVQEGKKDTNQNQRKYENRSSKVINLSGRSGKMLELEFITESVTSVKLACFNLKTEAKDQLLSFKIELKNLSLTISKKSSSHIFPANTFRQTNESEKNFISKIYLQKIQNILNEDESLQGKPSLDQNDTTIIEAFDILEHHYNLLKHKISVIEQEKRLIQEEYQHLQSSFLSNSELSNKAYSSSNSQSKPSVSSPTFITLMQNPAHLDQEKSSKLQNSLRQVKSKQKSLKKSFTSVKNAQSLIISSTKDFISHIKNLSQALETQSNTISSLETQLKSSIPKSKLQKYKKKCKTLTKKLNKKVTDYETLYKIYTSLTNSSQFN